MAKLEDEDESKKKNKAPEAHVTSLSVLRTHRKLGIATKLMRASHHQMQRVFGCGSCSLRVRVSNRAAITLYRDVLGYAIMDTDKVYYADKEDAYDMCINFLKKVEKEESKTTAEDGPFGKNQSVDTFAETNPKKKVAAKAAAEEEEQKEQTNVVTLTESE